MKLRSLLSILALVPMATPVAALTIDFEEFGHGDYVFSSQGVVIGTSNDGGGPNLGVAFGTNESNTSDEDLQRLSPSISGGESGWKTGNLAPNTDLGNILIIQEHTYSCVFSNCTDPDDEGSRPAGSFNLDFTGAATGEFTSFAFDLIDVEEGIRIEPGSIEFLNNGGTVAEFEFMDFLADPSVDFDDNSANHIAVLAGINFDEVIINLGGSGGIDNIVAGPIPEPSAALLFFCGLGVVRAGMRRR